MVQTQHLVLLLPLAAAAVAVEIQTEVVHQVVLVAAHLGMVEILCKTAKEFLVKATMAVTQMQQFKVVAAVAQGLLVALVLAILPQMEVQELLLQY
jgi:hypothetical protein